MLKKICCFLIILIAGSSYAGESDSTHVAPGNDSTKTVEDSTIVTDTLTEQERAIQLFHEKEREMYQQKKDTIPKVVKNYISYYDSLITHFTSQRLNQSAQIKRSFYRDAGDYFRSNASYTLFDDQLTPMRKTVQPFSLSGDRLNIIYNGVPLSPFEHVIEPDGLIDLNDIPTALDHDIYILPAGTGQIFGGSQSVATLLTVPQKMENTEPVSALLVDKGAYDYAYTRGRYSKVFTDGKNIDLSIDHRKTSGLRLYTADNSDHYTGKTKIPLNQTYDLVAYGTTLRRSGNYVKHPEYYYQVIDRSLTERNGMIAIERQPLNSLTKYHFGYLYKKQNSNLDISTGYKGRFNYFGNGLIISRESANGPRLFKMEVELQQLKFTDGFDSFKRNYGKASMSFAKTSGPWSFALTGGSEYMKTYNALPFGALVMKRESDRSLYLLSVGYSKKAPTLHDLNLKYQRSNIYSQAIDYAEKGNGGLQSEKQLVGSMLYQYGSLDNNISLTVTGGKILDGIDWHAADTVINQEYVKLFYPANGDINFADFNITQKFKIKNTIHVKAGGAYHYIDNKTFTSETAYQPEYRLFAGGELHWYWKQKWIDFYAYGEIEYTGPYTGYDGSHLGKAPVFNAGLSFSLKYFRFHYIFLNALQRQYYVREGNLIFGRYTYWGFTWNFFD